jgi:hypothetical protein
VRKFKIFFLTATVAGIISMIGCTKNNTTTVYTKDSVFTSNWTTLAMDSSSATNGAWEQTISAPAVTASILDNGVVLGYGAYVSSGTDTVVEQAIEFDLYQTFSVGSIFLQAGFDNSGLFYRYVIVPGSVLAGTKMTPQELKSMTYTEVTKLLSTTAKQAAAPTLTN